MSKNELLVGMNDKQTEAVLNTDGPLLIMAGAGSGKTRVLTHRIAYLIQDKQVLPWHILAITFTNKAAREMKERVVNLLGPSGNEVWVSTFHALCVRILRRNIDKLGYDRAFTIAGTSEQQTLIKNILKDLNYDPKTYNPRSILSSISNAKNDLQSPAEFIAKNESVGNPFIKVIGEVYDRYQKELHRNQSVDFDDLIMMTIQLFEQEPEVLKYYQDKFQYIHVDEYQDTNEAQYRLVHMLGEKYENVCVVGDADQSIYGWRGANMNNILDFQDDYPSAHVTLLEQNYRSTKTILKAANSVIQNNDERRDKNLWTENAVGEKITYYRAQSEADESRFVVTNIKSEMNDNHYSYGDFAVLYRTNAQSRVIEETLLKSNIPYTIVGGHKFYDRKEIQDILAYLTLMANPSDSMSLQRIINEPKRGIGAASVDKLVTFANENNWSVFEACQNVELNNELGSRARKAIDNFGAVMTDLQNQVPKLSVTDLTNEILEKTGYLATLKASKTLEASARIENIEEFLSVTKQFDDAHPDSEEAGSALVDFLSDLSLVSAQDDIAENTPEVTLMTLHAAKGLEFPVVFMIGMEDNIFPLSKAMSDSKELEEERRLAYVGITRAQKKLYLTNTFSRMLYGRRQTNPASQFIEEINPDLIDAVNSNGRSTNGGGLKTPFDTPNNRQARFANSSPYQGPTSHNKKTSSNQSGAASQSWIVGDKVSHKAWGTGTVVKVDGTGENMELDIAFPDPTGIKRLLAAFAPITKE
ncbi:DNA helicase PcrA [Nicoliella spurrieriana]|uniref:ATP-dependent DNA helicase n=1 Tax=Nicoliella spurrieriana TaxID=2925830 RepID=A0A976X544_9LACO|nr:DNA helicase PcrA [Nicoliella spurrieriana]UQS86384.1 DNA helicase PcrA [Nicoliella spurrieriana]